TLNPEDFHVLRNRTFDEIAIGDRASIERTLSAADIQLFAAMSGDVNPTHLDAEFAASTPFRSVVAHGMWAASLISTVLGTRLPGPGTAYVSQTLEFLAPVHVGDSLTVTVTVSSRGQRERHVVFDCRCVNGNGEAVMTGVATVVAPARRRSRARGTHRAPAQRAAARAHRALAGRRTRAPAAGRASAGSPEGCRGPPVRRGQPVVCARRARCRSDRAGAGGPARAAARGRRSERAGPR